jgi:hypothetical protein
VNFGIENIEVDMIIRQHTGERFGNSPHGEEGFLCGGYLWGVIRHNNYP